MKKSIKTVISFVLITLLALSFSSCSVFQSMRENALNAEKTTIYATPEKDQIISEYNTLLAASLKDATEIKENISYSAGKPDVLKAGEEAGVLDAGISSKNSCFTKALTYDMKYTKYPEATDKFIDPDFHVSGAFSDNMVLQHKQNIRILRILILSYFAHVD